MAEKSTFHFDLLGDPIPEGFGKRGRPPHIPTLENRTKVRLLLALDYDVADIAAALRITQPTLRKHYFQELRHRNEARFQLDGARLLALYKAMDGGNVGAAKELGRIMDKADTDRRTRAFGEADDSAARSSKPGKKEAAALAAKTAGQGTDWGDDLLPESEDGATRH